jgi:uncharacterized protein YjaZ
MNTFLLALCCLIISCGAKINGESHRPLTESEFSYYMIEKTCATNKVTLEPVTQEISKTYNDFVLKYPMSFVYIPPRFYDYKYPLVINLEYLAHDIKDLKERILDEDYLTNNVTNVALELFYLHQNSMRFEGQKCSIPQLITQQQKDLRPFMELRDFCKEKEQSDVCTNTGLEFLTDSEASFIQDKTIKLCKNFDNDGQNCEVQYSVNKENRTIGDLVSYYQNKFQIERFDKLFLLRDTHLSFQCQHLDDDSVQMHIKVYSKSIPEEQLVLLTKFVEDSWSREKFLLALEIVNAPGSDVVEIFSTASGTSYVPDQNNRQVYLSQDLDIYSSKSVLAHEFGHVLGFPDCYTEFFDNQNKDLIYYEIDKNNTNIMCSLKTGVSVPNEYLDQLAQNSCVFN